MNEKEFEKSLDNLIIKGLIQEAEQDNAEFEAAMREMSDEDFLALIYNTVDDHARAAVLREKDIVKDIVLANKEPVEMSSNIVFGASGVSADECADKWDDFDMPAAQSVPYKSEMTQKGWKIWAAAIASVAAILLIVFIPFNRYLDSRLCESALLASTALQGPTRGVDIASMSKEEVNGMLPELEMEYTASKHPANDIRYEKTPENDNSTYYIESIDPVESGLDLVQAYLKLNRKDDAIIVLRELVESNADPEFKEYCQKLLEILE